MSEVTQKERFRKLQALKQKSQLDNRKQIQLEFQRKRIDEKEQAKLEARQARAEFELSKLESIAQGKDFQREQAWGWTIEDVEKWNDKQKQKGRLNSKFESYDDLAEKTYNKDTRVLKTDLDEYKKQKELNAATHIPSKDVLESYVSNLQEKETKRFMSRRVNDGADSTFINEKNRQFNDKLSRHYDKYTSEIKDSLDRGSAIWLTDGDQYKAYLFMWVVLYKQGPLLIKVIRNSE